MYLFIDLFFYFLRAFGGKEWERCIELVWDERSNSSLCLFYLLNEQSATRFSSLEFTQRPVCQLGNSTCNRADSCERLWTNAFLRDGSPLCVCVSVCIHLHWSPRLLSKTDQSQSRVCLSPAHFDEWRPGLMEGWGGRRNKVGNEYRTEV